ncbi:MAG: phosphonate degradation operons associated domain protein [Ilumatobacteraceae bacterium]|nr:phosphonate degradation operons associated domain protein [Ilumatobacteraceae bacterium]MCU1388403.1 phosphonate degradation operons associated domain protein [Ilumatobacteraceae bacterium]
MIPADVDAAIDAIEAAFTSAEGMEYLGEDVTMIQHQLQAGALAAAAGLAEPLVVAALLHDIGHMVGHLVGEDQAVSALAADSDAHHDVAGARWLGQWFGPAVTEPVRLHVAAKRYLVSAESGYAALLSDASVHTLHLQGGPMSPAEVAAFDALAHSRAAVRLRRLDEQAKDAQRDAPGIETHRDLIRRVLLAG